PSHLAISRLFVACPRLLALRHRVRKKQTRPVTVIVIVIAVPAILFTCLAHGRFPRFIPSTPNHLTRLLTIHSLPPAPSHLLPHLIRWSLHQSI
ncbi:hypothetical protein CORC01_14300, partial [Colletotrichum orchidophilum]